MPRFSPSKRRTSPAAAQPFLKRWASYCRQAPGTGKPGSIRNSGLDLPSCSRSGTRPVSFRLRSWWSSAKVVAALAAALPATGAARGAETNAIDALDQVFLVVTVNGAGGGDAVLLLRGPRGAIYAPGDAVARWRLKPPAAAFQRDGRTYYALGAIEGAKISIDEAAQTLRIVVPPARLQPVRLAYE